MKKDRTRPPRRKWGKMQGCLNVDRTQTHGSTLLSETHNVELEGFNMDIQINAESKWAKLPRWEKRIHGFVCYFINAFVALWHPEVADRAMYRILSEQFIYNRQLWKN